MKNESPKYRYDKFNENWIIVKLSDIACHYKTGGTPSTKDPTFWGGAIPWIQSSDIQKDSLFGVIPQKFISEEGLQNSTAKLIPKNSIAIVTRVGVGKLAIIDQDYTTSQDFLSLSDFNGDTQFIAYSIYRMLQKESTQLQGTSIKGITKEDLLSKKISLPEIEEQSAIGSLFRTLDNLLSSYKDNLANYQSLKATMLSKMFPKAGQNVPEIRLDGFEGEWENSKISDYVYLLNGRAFKQDELLNEGKYRVVRVGNFNTNEKWYYSNLELEENKYANKDDLLYLWATNFGPEIWKEEKIIFHYHIWKLEFDRSIIDRNYLYYWLEKDKKRIQQNTNGSTMVHVTKSMMENREFLFPMFREQQAIGTYFSNLDSLITAYQEKISQLETLKKKLLQDMFI
ncbi:restriction endonuclease subunit S [Streptococcus parasanguinis]|uniref:restriction endonuclease subunit S n=1 Tax=Streptococcus parasanguinis TaxID=1318 RepID=UPI0012BD569F|nr:restriction endonuclease subunit S [Streptococcus parasanguinis]MTS08077.1 restriction endonuclease subunit S [Streptococcus parasanguinis]